MKKKINRLFGEDELESLLDTDSERYCKVVKEPNLPTHVYVNNDISSLHHYTELLELLRAGSCDDKIFLHINTEGGYTDTALTIHTALQESEATTTSCLYGVCISAGTIIALGADHFEVGPHVVFMAHQSLGGYCGSADDCFKEAKFRRLWEKGVYETVYKGFLTGSEIASLLEGGGKEHYFNQQELQKRLTKYARERTIPKVEVIYSESE